MNSPHPLNNPSSAPGSPARRALLLPLAISAVFALALGLVLWHPSPPVPPSTASARPPEFNRTNLSRISGRWCLTGHTNPVTGILLEYYPDGALQSRSAISNGLLEGLSEGWYTNRQLQVREYYRTNYSDGPRSKWYPDGQKLSEGTIVLGKMQGTFRRWYENGQLAEQVPMRDGKIEGLGWTYYQSGFEKSEVTLHNDQITDAKSWPDGKHDGGSSISLEDSKTNAFTKL